MARRVLVATLVAAFIAAGTAATPAAGTPPTKDARSISEFGCLPGLTSTFTDIAGDVHEDGIVCIAAWGIAGGTTPTTYAPGNTVNRGQMASFIYRLLAHMGIPMDTGDQGFTDIEGSAHRDAINGIASVGVAMGTTPSTFEPDAPVNRAQMASFLYRGIILEIPPPTDAPNPFNDDNGSVHEAAINILAVWGIVQGTGPDTYSPDNPVARAAMGSFVARSIDFTVAGGVLRPLREARVLFAGMEGSQEVPGPGEDGIGSAVVTAIGIPGTLCVRLYATGLSGAATAAHIHEGQAGEAGPPVVTLPTPLLQPEGFQVAEGCVAGIDPDVSVDIQDNPASYYVNIHTEASPSGAVRGQLAVRSTESLAVLSGAQEVPGPGDPDANGVATVNTTGDSNVVCQQVFVRDVDPTIGSHIHRGGPDEAGPVVVALTTPNEVSFPICMPDVDANVRDDLTASPEDFYVNVHTEPYPDGALRGQLVRTTRRAAVLTPTAEVPGPGDSDATGSAFITIEGGTNVCFEITTANLGPGTAAHIHEGGEGASGPPVVTLEPPNPGGLVSGCVNEVDPTLAGRIAATPEDFYVNVHTSEHPDGAIRGQLEPTS